MQIDSLLLARIYRPTLENYWNLLKKDDKLLLCFKSVEARRK